MSAGASREWRVEQARTKSHQAAPQHECEQFAYPPLPQAESLLGAESGQINLLLLLGCSDIDPVKGDVFHTALRVVEIHVELRRLRSDLLLAEILHTTTTTA
jgi:hypothetical protein